MNTDDIMLMCSIGKIYPTKYDCGGWCNFLTTLKQLGMEVKDQMEALESFPASKREVEAIAANVRKKMNAVTDVDTGKVMILSITADEFFKLSEDKQEKEFENYIRRVEWLEFPPYILEIDPMLQKYIAKNFMYTYGKDGSTIVYNRVLDTPGVVWEEVGDSEKPFTKSKGSLRAGLVDHLVVRSKSKVVTVFINVDGEERKVYDHIPYWKIHKKYLDKTMSYIKGTPEAVARFRERVESWILMLKNCYDGKLKDVELQRGMQEIPVKLAELDDNIDNNTFFYHKSINLPILTNSPDEPAMAYFDLHNITEGPTPDFDGFMESIHPACRDSLMAAIYGTFFAKCKLNQYVWIHGEGGDGKSSLLNAIAKYAGDRLACSLSAADMKSEFGLENTVGKRMVIMSDVKTGLSVKSALIHNLTGHDLISINRKNRPVISVRLNPIVWIAANDAPDVNFDNRNEARRCLYIKMVEPPEEIQRKFYFTNKDGTFDLDEDGEKQNNGYDLEGHLVKEMPHILYKCREAFERVCPAPYSVIKQSSEALHIAKENCLDIDASTFHTYIQETFSFKNPDAKLLQTEIYEALADTMRDHNDKKAMDNFLKRDIKRMLNTRYKCQQVKIKGIHYMKGIMRKRDSMEPIPDPTTGRTVYVPDNPQFNAEDIV